jgi:hypothetical protein
MARPYMSIYRGDQLNFSFCRPSGYFDDHAGLPINSAEFSRASVFTDVIQTQLNLGASRISVICAGP